MACFPYCPKTIWLEAQYLQDCKAVQGCCPRPQIPRVKGRVNPRPGNSQPGIRHGSARTGRTVANLTPICVCIRTYVPCLYPDTNHYPISRRMLIQAIFSFKPVRLIRGRKRRSMHPYMSHNIIQGHNGG